MHPQRVGDDESQSRAGLRRLVGPIGYNGMFVAVLVSSVLLVSATCIAPVTAAMKAPEVGTIQHNQVSTNVNNSWAGANMYYLWACNQTVRQEYLQTMANADLKVLRIFLLNSCTEYSIDCQGYNTCDDVPDVENPVGVWNDEILGRVDDLMVDAAKFGIKLTIALHDRWSLGCWRADAYVQKYNISIISSCATEAGEQDPSPFYLLSEAQADFQNRIDHILEHENPHFGVAWKDLTSVVFSWQPENEPRYYSNPEWLGMMTSTIKTLSPNILVTTGGPAGGLAEPPALELAQIPSVDILTIHDYSNEIVSKIQAAEAACAQYSKRYLLEEFGFQGDSSQSSNYQNAINDALSTYATPWMFWMLGQGGGQDSLNIFPGQPAYDNVVAPEAQNTAQQISPQSWPEIWN
eukprot:TRINITY_DN15535_c0_g1_i1.p1 TRINITY_DN15535_c0_g1~~TRINITY_DN15535_c0_g1_i1.p1  ORF type:complete len:421 (-),score=62.75 TRINITY_DN15535_c0_g1_i1:55-1275(-)